jgi:DNA-binding protein HU-beta
LGFTRFLYLTASREAPTVRADGCCCLSPEFFTYEQEPAVNKSELAQKLAERTNLSKSEASKAVDALFSTSGIIAEELRNGGKVQITGFGSFETRSREARTGRNPRTGKEIEIGASTSAAFRAGKGLKDSLGTAGGAAGGAAGAGAAASGAGAGAGAGAKGAAAKKGAGRAAR